MNVQICRATGDFINDIRSLYWPNSNDTYLKPNWNYDKLMIVSEEILDKCKEELCYSYHTERTANNVVIRRYKFDGNEPDVSPAFGNSYSEEVWFVKLTDNFWAICKVDLFCRGEVYTYTFNYTLGKTKMDTVHMLVLSTEGLAFDSDELINTATEVAHIIENLS